MKVLVVNGKPSILSWLYAFLGRGTFGRYWLQRHNSVPSVGTSLYAHPFATWVSERCSSPFLPETSTTNLKPEILCHFRGPRPGFCERGILSTMHSASICLLLYCHFGGLNPPRALNPKPQTLNPKRQALHPKPAHPKPHKLQT